MAVTTAVVAVAGLGTSIYSSVDNAKHAATDASNNANVAQDEMNAQTKQNSMALDNQAQTTGAAQARVRAISNPDGNSILTSPLGASSAGANSTNTSAPPPSPGMLTPPGKSTVGG